MRSIHKVNPKTLRVTIHAARSDGTKRTVCGQVITRRDSMLSPYHYEPQTEITCQRCKRTA